MASEKWAGFTDEDIERIKTNPSNKNNNYLKQTGSDVTRSSGPLKIKAVSAERAFKKREPVSDSSKDETSDSDSEFSQDPYQFKTNSVFKEFPNPVKELSDSLSKTGVHEKNSADMSDDSCVSSEASKREDNSSEKGFKCNNSSLQDLEMFELRQKRIEAENTRRRVLINKAIMDKKMQTQAESVKLAKITHELNRLDSILSADVSILRDYIEKASLDFSEAEKRYLKAEREFIEAKLHLFEKMQRKEQLTEHLCAIIEQNENRKAQKLVELMKQLEMEAIIEDYQANDSQPILSKFCILNDEAYHCCQTLKPPSPTNPCVDVPLLKPAESPILFENQTQDSDNTEILLDNEKVNTEKET